MDKKKIIIITGSGGILGTGHMQRMLNLAFHLNSHPEFSVSIYLKHKEFPFPEKFNELLIDQIPFDTNLIIRDMRDSSIKEMNLLKQTAPVLTIDDSGAGRKSADYVINLLPIPSEILNAVKPETSYFLYGYNFSEGINILKKITSLKKDIDVAVYAGFDPSPELISLIRKSIPESACSVILTGGRSLNLTGRAMSEEISYAETIFRSKIVITHFGLTMFEANLCGCKIAALDPSAYHNSLTDIVNTDFNIIYSSEYNSFSSDALYNIIEREIFNFTPNDISPDYILNKINSHTENFISYIKKICSNSDSPHGRTGLRNA